MNEQEYIAAKAKVVRCQDESARFGVRDKTAEGNAARSALREAVDELDQLQERATRAQVFSQFVGANRIGR